MNTKIILNAFLGYIGFIIVTSDRGLAGSFNTNIIKKAEKEIKQYKKEDVKLFCIGKSENVCSLIKTDIILFVNIQKNGFSV